MTDPCKTVNMVFLMAGGGRMAIAMPEDEAKELLGLWQLNKDQQPSLVTVKGANFAVSLIDVIALYFHEPKPTLQERLMAAQERLAAAALESGGGHGEGEEWKK